MAKAEQIRVRVDTATRARLESLASREQRTLSNMVRVLLDRALRDYPTHPADEGAERQEAQ